MEVQPLMQLIDGDNPNPERAGIAPFRLMSFDGGGVHAVSYLPVIADLERHLGSTIAASGQFQMLAGTSTGAIVATALKLGTRAGREGNQSGESKNATILDMYLESAADIFRKAWPWHWPFFLYASNPLRKVLAEFYRSRTELSTDITWLELAERSPYPELELVVTLWDVTHERTAYLSTNLNRPNQAEELWNAALADVITACCSAPVFFPARWFRSAGAEYAFCDGGITGLNSPATFGVSLIHSTLTAQRVPLHVVSFGAGEVPQSEDASATPTIKQFRNRSVLQLAPAAITALMNSTSRLMDQFYYAFGSTLNVTRYLRTNHPRSPESKLDDAAIVPELTTQFLEGAIYYDLWRSDEGKKGDEKTVSRTRHQHSKDAIGKWREMWTTEFGLMSVAGASSEASPIVPPLQGVSLPNCAASEMIHQFDHGPLPAESPPLDSTIEVDNAITGQMCAVSAKVLKGVVESGEIRPTWRAVLRAPMVLAVLFMFISAVALTIVGLRKARDLADAQAKIAIEKFVLEEERRKTTEAERQKVIHENQCRIVSEHESSGVANMNRGHWLEALPNFSAALTSELKVNPRDDERLNLHRLRIAGVLAAAPHLVNHVLLQSPPAAARFMPDGKRLFVAVDSDKAFYLDTGSNEVSEIALQVPSPERSVATMKPDLLSPDAGLLLGRTNFTESLQLWQADPLSARFSLDIPGFDFAEFSPDGTYLAAIEDRKNLWLWDVSQGTRVVGPVLWSRDVVNLQFSEQSDRLLIVSEHSVLDLLPPQIGEKPRDIPEFVTVLNLKTPAKSDFAGAFTAALSPDGRFIAVGRNAGGVDLINIEANDIVLHMPGPGGLLRQLFYSPRGEWLFGVFQTGFPGTGRIIKWQVAPGNPALDPGQPIGPDIHRDISIEFARLSPDGTMLLAVCSNGTSQHHVQVFDVSSGKPVAPPLPSNGRITVADFSPEGRRIIVASEEGDGKGLLKVWDLASPFQVAPVIEPKEAPQLPEYLRVGKVKEWSRDGRRVAVLLAEQNAENPTLVVYDAIRGNEIARIPAAESGGKLNEVNFSHSGRFLAVNFLVKHRQTVQSIVFVFDLEVPSDPILSSNFTRLYSTAFNSTDSHFLAHGSEGARLYDLRKSPAPPEVRDLSLSKSSNDATFSPSGRRVAVWAGPYGASTPQSVQVYNADSGEQVSSRWECPQRIDDVVFSNDDRRLLMLAGTHVIRWNLTEPKPVDQMLEHSEKVERALFNVDNRWIATTTRSHIRVWDADTGNHLSRLFDNRFGIGSVRFGDGGLLLSGDEPFLSTWYAQTGDPALPSYEILDAINRFSPQLSLNSKFLVPQAPLSPFPTPVGQPQSHIDLLPDMVSDNDLKYRIPLLSGRTVDATGAVVPVTPEQLQELFDKLRRGQGGSLEAPAASQIVWHERLSDQNWNLAYIGGAFASRPHSEALVKLLPENGEHFSQLGIDQVNLGDWSGCVASLNRAIELGLDYVEVRSSLAHAQIELGQLQPAEESLEKAIALGADLNDLAWLRRKIAFRRRYWQEVINTVEALPEELRNADAGALSDRGWALAELGDFQKATPDFKAAADRAPTVLDYARNHAHAALAAGDIDAYSASCSQLLKRYDDQSTDQWQLLSPTELSNVAWACSLARHDESASQHLHVLALMAAGSAKDDIDVWLILAQVQLRRKDFAQVADTLPKEIDQLEAHQQAYIALFHALAEIGQGKKLEPEAPQRLRKLVDNAVKVAEKPEESSPWQRRSHLNRLLSECMPPEVGQ